MAASSMHHSNIGSLLNSFDYVGENIADGPNAPVSSLHVAWMHSQDHRDNISPPASPTPASACSALPTDRCGPTTDFGRRGARSAARRTPAGRLPTLWPGPTATTSTAESVGR
jgi:hypothetical protein